MKRRKRMTRMKTRRKKMKRKKRMMRMKTRKKERVRTQTGQTTHSLTLLINKKTSMRKQVHAFSHAHPPCVRLGPGTTPFLQSS